jgi:hypothetical protein
MIDLNVRQLVLSLCLIISVLISLRGTGSVFATSLTNQASHFLQQSPLSPLATGESYPPPIAMVEQQSIQFPFNYGSQANQTSLVLIGAVLLGLVVIGTLVVTRRE